LSPASQAKRTPEKRLKLLNLQILIAPESEYDYSMKKGFFLGWNQALNDGRKGTSGG
jgi:hypothetical protein